MSGDIDHQKALTQQYKEALLNSNLTAASLFMLSIAGICPPAKWAPLPLSQKQALADPFNNKALRHGIVTLDVVLAHDPNDAKRPWYPALQEVFMREGNDHLAAMVALAERGLFDPSTLLSNELDDATLKAMAVISPEIVQHKISVEVLRTFPEREILNALGVAPEDLRARLLNQVRPDGNKVMFRQAEAQARGGDNSANELRARQAPSFFRPS